MSKDPKTESTGKVKFVKVDKGQIEKAFPEATSEDTTELPLERTLEGALKGNIEGNLEPDSEPAFTLDPKKDLSEGHPKEPNVMHDEGVSQKEAKPQTDILKKYIDLKEREGRDHKEQLRHYETHVARLKEEVKTLQDQNHELSSDLQITKKEVDGLQREILNLKKKQQEELGLLKNVYEDRLQAAGKYEVKLDGLKKEKEEWKSKIKEDLAKIRIKEKELENKYELLKRDAQALIDSKDKHVLELKKKSDSMEIELESKEDLIQQTSRALSAIDAKKTRLIETLKLAIHLLEKIDRIDEDSENRKVG